MNPKPSTGNNSLSDVGGVTTGTNLDLIFSSLIEKQTPTSTNNINTGGILERTACPSINAVGASDTKISGSCSFDVGKVTTIEVSVYNADGSFDKKGTTTTTNGSWEITISTFYGSSTIAANKIVKATATIEGKGTSYDNCSVTTVTGCTQQTAMPTSTEITQISGKKGFNVTISRPIGTKIYFYNSDYTLYDTSVLIGTPSNPFVTTTVPATINFGKQTGNSFSNTGTYYFRFEEPDKCISDYYISCDYTPYASVSSTPTITNTTITPETTSITGRGNTASSTIIIYADGVKIVETTSGASSPYNFTATVSGLVLGQVITAKQVSGNSCISSATEGITVTRQAIKPIINFSGCAPGTVTSVSGFSTEIGATITLYRTDGTRTSLGTTTVASDGTWTKTGLSLTSGNIIVAAVTSGTYLTTSPDSEPVTIATQTNAANYTVSITTPTEGQTVASGTISGGTYPVTLKVYVDDVLVGEGVSVSAAGNWSVPGLNSFDLAVGSTVKVTLTASSSCESNYNSVYAIVQCIAPTTKIISTTASAVCSGAYGYITINNSENGVIYTPVLSTNHTTFGYEAVGNGSNVVIITNQLTSNTVVKVKAAKFPYSTCTTILPDSVLFVVNVLPTAPTATTPQYYCSSAVIGDLVATVPSGYTVRWYASATGGTPLSTGTNLVAGTTYYAEAENTATGCISATRTAVLVQEGTPVAPSASSTQLFNPGATVANLQATLSGPGTLYWYTAPSGGTALNSATALTDQTTYYAENKQGSCSSSRVAVLVQLRWSVTTVVSNGSISKSVSGTASDTPNMSYYSDATSVTFTGEPDWEYALTAWKVNGSTVSANPDGTLTLSIDENKTVEAVFTKYAKYRTFSDGEWTSAMFKATADNSTYFDVYAPFTTAVPIEVAHHITIPEEETITVGNVLLTASAKLVNEGELIINDTITFTISKDSAAQLVNTLGTVTNDGVVRIRRHYKKEEEWVFMSFPFDVAENHIFYAGTQTVPSWGGARDDGYIFYVAEYDGYNRDRLSTGPPNYTGVGVYWKDVVPKVLKKRQGYIIAADNDLDIDFVSESSVNYMFDPNATLGINKYTTNPLPVHISWNLVGLPYLSGFDLLGATQDFAPYYYYNYTIKSYKPVMMDESYVVAPFTSFFMQAWGAPNVISYNPARIALKAAIVNDYDEINITVSNNKYSDEARIRLKNDAKEGYELGNDAMKFMSPAKEVPQIYTKTSGYNLSVNSLPINSKKVDLGVYIGEKGRYNLKLKDIEKINKCSQVILIDNITGTQTDLLVEEEGYAFDSDKVGTTNRFSILLVSEGTSAIEATQGQNILIQAIGDKLYVDGLEREATVLVYDVSGKLVQRFVNVNNNDALSIANAGIYVVDVKNETQQGKAKISIKK
jgi:hypothetical protein